MTFNFSRSSRLTGLPPFEFFPVKKKGKRPTIDELLQREEQMTICIAAMAQDAKTHSPAIVFASDRQLSNDFFKYETSISKSQILTDYACMLCASSDTSISDEIIVKVGTLIEVYEKSEGVRLSIENIAKILSKACIERYNREVGREIRLNWGFILDDPQNPLLKDVMKDVIKEETRNFKDEFEATFIIVGIDQNNQFFCPHIFYVDEKGRIKSRDARGWDIQGNGQAHALFEFMRCNCESPVCNCGYLPDMETSEVIFRVYKAKKAAERTGKSVGEATHLGILQVMDGKIGYKFISNFTAQKVIDSKMTEVKKVERYIDHQKIMPELDRELEGIPLFIPSEFDKKQKEEST